jgi:hypothetical protein
MVFTWQKRRGKNEMGVRSERIDHVQRMKIMQRRGGRERLQEEARSDLKREQGAQGDSTVIK